jgi:glycerol-3-phosphate acyltransferase PlsY
MLDLFALLFAYLIGSIPFGLVLTRWAGLGDIRTLGSGNIGATNVLRTGNKKLAAATLFLDMAKGVVAVILANAMGEGHFITGFAAFAAVAGHVFPLWLNFKGGKGVATTFGACLAFAPLIGISGIMVWLSVFLFTRISSLSALLSIGMMPLIALISEGLLDACYLAPIAVLVIYRHRDNITRLKAGIEPKSGHNDALH